MPKIHKAIKTMRYKFSSGRREVKCKKNRHPKPPLSSRSIRQREKKATAKGADQWHVHHRGMAAPRATATCERGVRRAIVAARKGERGNAAAEGAIHPETLRQMDRSCNELWRAAHAGGVAPTDGAAGCDLIRSPRISQVNGQGGELDSSSPFSCFCNQLE